MKKTLDKILKIVYGVFIALVVVVALIFIIPLLPIPGNYNIKVVLSGSMEPDIKTGAIVLVKPENSYEVGDIINFDGNFRLNGQKLSITHRVTEKNIDEATGNITYKTKGDANDDEDFEMVSHNKVLGRVIFDVPYIGYVVETAQKPYGFLALILIPAGIIIFDQSKVILQEFKKMKKDKDNQLSDEQKNV